MTGGASPYDGLPPEAFWRSGVAERAPLDPGALYQPRFRLTRKDRIATAGSCFAQHVGRALRGAGLDVLDGEPLPDAVPDALAERYGYRLYSGRYGNIYTVRQLDQLLTECDGEVHPAHPVWGRDGQFFDAQRPGVEPEGLDTPEDVLRHRAAHLRNVKETLSDATVFVFTLGLTEAWEDKQSGTVYPTAPGTIAGDYDPDVFGFRNFGFNDVVKDFHAVRARLKTWVPEMRFIITVSPVPLTATASGQHVEVATAQSKAILRAAAARIVERYKDVDYVPSYEIITSQTARGMYFAPNMRSVTPAGVAAAMGTFLGAHGLSAKPARPRKTPAPEPGPAPAPSEASREAELVCEEALLEAFAK